MGNIYDFIVIGAGISGCTFASYLNKRFPQASILIVETGRRLGGRATTRQSRGNKNLQFDHGLPSIEFSNNISNDLLTFVSPLIKSRKLINITEEVLFINEFGKMSHLLSQHNIYRSVPFMVNFCQELINQATDSKQINFIFRKFVKSIIKKNNLWHLKIDEANLMRSKNLVLSSSLIAHSRCLEIMNIHSLPLREAFMKGKDTLVDSVINKTSQIVFMKRTNYILHVSSIEFVKTFNYDYLQIYFSEYIRVEYKFERIIFQRQLDGSIIIVLHCSYINKDCLFEVKQIIKNLLIIFSKHQIFVDLFLNAKHIDTMNWRASQPINNLLPAEFQWSQSSNIGFCGDWFDFDGCAGVEAAMNNSIRLAKFVSC